MIVRERKRGKVRRGILAAAAIVGLGLGLALLASVGQPWVIRRPDATERPVLLVADFDNQTARGELLPFTRRVTEVVREQLAAEPNGIFRISTRRLRPVLDSSLREDGLVAIAARLGADYVLAGSLESGPGGEIGPGSRWAASAGADREEDTVRLDILLVRDAEPPEVFAERFPLGTVESVAGDPERLAAIIADRIALSLSRF